MFLKLSGQIESQLRDAYAKKYGAGILNQSSLAAKLDVGRSVINRRLTGGVNMTEESIADMVWGLDHDIEVKIFDPTESPSSNKSITHKQDNEKPATTDSTAKTARLNAVPA